MQSITYEADRRPNRLPLHTCRIPTLSRRLAPYPSIRIGPAGTCTRPCCAPAVRGRVYPRSPCRRGAEPSPDPCFRLRPLPLHRLCHLRQDLLGRPADHVATSSPAHCPETRNGPAGLPAGPLPKHLIKPDGLQRCLATQSSGVEAVRSGGPQAPCWLGAGPAPNRPGSAPIVSTVRAASLSAVQR